MDIRTNFRRDFLFRLTTAFLFITGASDLLHAQLIPQPAPLDFPTPDHSYDPGPNDLSPSTLKAQLGGDFVPRYMSVSRPLESIIRPNGSFDYSNFHISNEIKALRFAKFPGKFGGKAAQRRQFRKKIRQFLASYSFCPVKYRWRDLSIRFFPRWIREGTCYNEPGQSCSIPPSNKCQTSKSQNLRLLRWHCRNWERGLFCRWISIWYPIVTACECKC
ncbi:hypothetical protein RvY_01592 [Ramazzottius varieornatus]|uniref:Noggin n=1 Tax=Ramazzottius varieornatus TaxID=947166 RepID=A0A1D1UKB4_RAMVA|nr:hypothetical protein RvY_01592 [Ramazzottius varieornatus]